jgi:hypothetical protein
MSNPGDIGAKRGPGAAFLPAALTADRG